MAGFRSGGRPGHRCRVFLPHLAELGNPASISTPPATRPQLAAVANVLDVQPATLGPGEARAGLIIAHGVLRRFFTYFD